MKMTCRVAALLAGAILSVSCSAQKVQPANTQKENTVNQSNRLLTWRQVASNMPDEWYNSDEAIKVADSVLTYQTKIGGWSKNHDYVKGFNQEEWAGIQSTGIGATFDNGATLTEMRFLAKMYNHVKDERYRTAFYRGFNYILQAQYKNGGWPQFYPTRPGKGVAYNAHITYNDDAMVNVMRFLKDIGDGNPEFSALNVGADLTGKAKQSFDKGVDCILRTQIRVKNQPAVWCAQHDEKTLAPANARAYELASYSGGESVGITMLLMDIDSPSKEIIDAVKGSVQWFNTHKLEGIRLQEIINKDGQKDRVVVEDKNAPALWARFYDLDTELPYFCDRNGIKLKTFAELGYERRNGYSWYTAAPAKMLQRYHNWAATWVND